MTAFRAGHLDSAPLVEAIMAAALRVGEQERADGKSYRVSPGLWAEREGICSHRQFLRWKAGQDVRYPTADRVAVALGWHPAELWGDDWWKGAA